MATGNGKTSYRPPRRAVAAFLFDAGASAPVGRPRWASWGAGVRVPGAARVDVTTVPAGSLPRSYEYAVNLTRLAAGSLPPRGYRLVSEA